MVVRRARSGGSSAQIASIMPVERHDPAGVGQQHRQHAALLGTTQLDPLAITAAADGSQHRELEHRLAPCRRRVHPGTSDRRREGGHVMTEPPPRLARGSPRPPTWSSAGAGLRRRPAQHLRRSLGARHLIADGPSLVAPVRGTLGR